MLVLGKVGVMRIAFVLVLGLILAGCTPNSTTYDVVPNGNEASAVTEPTNSSEAASYEDEPNEWVRACEHYEPDTSEDFLAVYDQVIRDVCSNYDLDARAIPAVLSSTVNPKDAERYLNSEAFHEGYWAKFMAADFPVKQRVIFTELDEKWWEQQMKSTLLEPELGWFTSTTEGGHCRVESTIFCPKFYEGKLTKSGLPVEFRIIGTELNWDDWRVLNGAHESTHLYQDSYGMSHWASWYIEGQATFYEIAMSRLLFDNNNIRREYVYNRPARQDAWQIDASSVKSVLDFLDKCDHAQQGECDGFKYGGGSLFHEKLILDYGFEKYMDWQTFLINNMPMGNPMDLTREVRDQMVLIFDQSFVEVFGISKSEWEREVMAPYLMLIY